MAQAYLPLTVAAARAAARSRVPPPARASAAVVQRRAEQAELAAATCWGALLDNRASLSRRTLLARLKALTEATAIYAGRSWWLADGSGYRRKVATAQELVEAAVQAGATERFAAALTGYDQAVATTVIAVQERMGQ